MSNSYSPTVDDSCENASSSLVSDMDSSLLSTSDDDESNTNNDAVLLNNPSSSTVAVGASGVTAGVPAAASVLNGDQRGPGGNDAAATEAEAAASEASDGQQQHQQQQERAVEPSETTTSRPDAENREEDGASQPQQQEQQEQQSQSRVLTKATSFLSDCPSSCRPDPPSVIDHKEAEEFNIGASNNSEFVPRGCDAEASLATGPIPGGGDDQQDDDSDGAEEEEEEEIALHASSSIVQRGAGTHEEGHNSTSYDLSGGNGDTKYGQHNQPAMYISVPSKGSEGDMYSGSTQGEEGSTTGKVSALPMPEDEEDSDGLMSPTTEEVDDRISYVAEEKKVGREPTVGKDPTPSAKNDPARKKSATTTNFFEREAAVGDMPDDSADGEDLTESTSSPKNVLHPIVHSGGPDDGVEFMPQNESGWGAPPPPPIQQQQQQQPNSLFSPVVQHSQSLNDSHHQQQPQQSALQSSFKYAPQSQHQQPSSFGAPRSTRYHSGRRKIHLRLQEDAVQQQQGKMKQRPGLLGHIRTRSQRIMFGGGGGGSGGGNSELNTIEEHNLSEKAKPIERGLLSVSWFEGTSSLELQEHVRRSVVRKLHLDSHHELTDIRVLDEGMDPPEEIVLSPHIPDGSHFLLRFSIRDTSNDGTATPLSFYSGRAPESPSAAPPRLLFGDMNAKQVELLRRQLHDLKTPLSRKPGHMTLTADGTEENKDSYEKKSSKRVRRRKDGREDTVENVLAHKTPDQLALSANKDALEGGDGGDGKGEAKSSEDELSESLSETDSDEDDMLLHSEDPIEARLRQITELLISDRKERRGSTNIVPRKEKRQVIFVLANYFVLFLSLIAISAEIQARAPGWLSSLEEQYKNVQDCAADQEALFHCVSNGDFAGIVAAVILWLSRSVATRRIFLFGFETPKKLWTVVYESLVTSVCWGISYLFIRRGMNPDTRDRFVKKYWKDAVYGSLAGFNAAFMKQILKNLIPQEAVEDALRDRQLKFLSWLPSY